MSHFNYKHGQGIDVFAINPALNYKMKAGIDLNFIFIFIFGLMIWKFCYNVLVRIEKKYKFWKLLQRWWGLS